MYRLGSINVEPQASWLQQITSSLTSALPAIAQVYSQKKLIDVQASRARAGLAPLPPAYLQPAPFRVETSVGVAPNTQRTMLMVGAGAIAALALFAFMRK